MEVLYCESCGSRIIDSDLKTGAAVVVEEAVWCPACADKAPAAASTGQPATARVDRRPTRAIRIDIQRSKRPSRITGSAPRRSGAATVAVVIVALAVGVISAWLLLGSPGEGEPPADGVKTAAPPAATPPSADPVVPESDSPKRTLGLQAMDDLDEGGVPIAPVVPERVQPLTVSDSGVNLARSANVIASSTLRDNSPAGKAIDGDRTSTSSRWISGDAEKASHIILEWPEAKTVSTVKIWTGFTSAAACVKDYNIQVHDGTKWAVVAEVSGNTRMFNELKFEKVETKRLKMEITSKGQLNVARIFEIEVYE